MAGNEDLDRLMAQMQGMMQSGVQLQVVRQVVTAYDQCATVALQALIRAGGWHSPSEKEIAQLVTCAWEIADAMMIERRRRGLGAMPKGE